MKCDVCGRELTEAELGSTTIVPTFDPKGELVYHSTELCDACRSPEPPCPRCGRTDVKRRLYSGRVRYPHHRCPHGRPCEGSDHPYCPDCIEAAKRLRGEE